MLNNGAHDSVGGQPTVGLDVDLGQIALACGYRSLGAATDLDGIRAACPEILAAAGPVMLEIRVRRGPRADLGRPKATPADAKRQLMGALDATQSSDVRA